MPDPTAPAGTDDLHDQIRTALAGCVPFGEWDLDRKTRAVMTVVAPELERLRAELERQERDFAQLGELYVHACRGAREREKLRQCAEQAEAERDALKAATDRIRQIHRQAPNADHCHADLFTMPCPTIRALDGSS